MPPCGDGHLPRRCPWARARGRQEEPRDPDHPVMMGAACGRSGVAPLPFVPWVCRCFRHQDAPSHPSPAACGKREWHTRVALSGAPSCCIARFRHQDAQTPPSLLGGEGGREDAHKCRVFKCAIVLSRLLQASGRQNAPLSRAAGEGLGVRAKTGVRTQKKPLAPQKLYICEQGG